MKPAYKKEMKEVAQTMVDELKYCSDATKTRIMNVCRANINRLSYDLHCENNTIFIKRGDRIRMIETSRNATDDMNTRLYILKQATAIMNAVRIKFPKPEKVIA